MKSVVFFVLFATTLLVTIVFGEPVQYRQNQQAKSAKQTVETVDADDEKTDGKSEQENVRIKEGPYYILKAYPSGPLLVVPLDQPKSDSTTVETTNSEDDLATTTENSENEGPYSPSGWKPSGQLLILPNEEIAVSATAQPTPEQPTARCQQEKQSGRLINKAEQIEQEEIAVADNNESEATTPTTNSNAKGDAEKIGTTESKEQKTNGKLETDNSSEDANDDATTETPSSSTQQPSSKLETTSEPESETVDVELQPESQSPAVGRAVPPLLQSQPGAFIIQLPDGSLQRFVFVAAQPNAVLPNANLPPNALLPVSPFQQLVQPQAASQSSQTFGHNPIASPRVVTFSSQYQAF